MRRHFAQGTSVGVEKSRAEIDRILSKVGATQRAVGHDDEQDKMWEQACRERWRVLTLLLKAKLEAHRAGPLHGRARVLGGHLPPRWSHCARSSRGADRTRVHHRQDASAPREREVKVYRYTHPCADCPKEILRTAIRCRECYFALRRSQPRSRVAIHGPMYAAWKQMRQRCNNPKCSRYKWYGARGIKVCVRWNSFDLFLKDMGPRPTPKHSVERRKNHLGYTPGNCLLGDHR